MDFEVWTTSTGGQRYVGVWRPGSGEELVTGQMTEEAFLSRGQQLAEQEGMRLIDVEVELVDGRLLYSGLWQTGSGSNKMTTPLAPSAFRALRDQMLEDGLELRDVERVQVGGQTRFVGVWASGDGESIITVPRELTDFVALGEQLTAQGRRTRDLEIILIPDRPEDPLDEDPMVDLRVGRPRQVCQICRHGSRSICTQLA